ncbi:orotate phosphoribosyltransferase [Fimbriimonas ginsengisoli]|uniref:Orotate phosphoribosyltransferase n=1 Tax=Fimbriimonas ginsengisoli Gsoil 348 TaxID=661478 RepID=A0A068NX01_FIMGI|nr:orotate phosphoribosyltransferase [Fimbriimonas ginsengisoli]AIE87310.1 orotate phosphoribosyltransferase [Fimbriimonas ginsengisoli Gsoil 348]
MDLGQLLEDSGAILRGHFLLTSGRHSEIYFEKFRILEQPHVLSALCTEIAAQYRGANIEAVAGPTTGGIIIAFEVARQLGLPSIYVESENGVKTLRRNKTLPPGQRVLVVDDVLTTGTSLLESRQAIETAGGEVVGFGVLIDRSQPGVEFGAPLYGAYKVEAQSYAPDDIPDWLAEIPVTKPGTRVASAPSR